MKNFVWTGLFTLILLTGCNSGVSNDNNSSHSLNSAHLQQKSVFTVANQYLNTHSQNSKLLKLGGDDSSYVTPPSLISIESWNRLVSSNSGVGVNFESSLDFLTVSQYGTPNGGFAGVQDKLYLSNLIIYNPQARLAIGENPGKVELDPVGGYQHFGVISWSMGIAGEDYNDGSHILLGSDDITGGVMVLNSILGYQHATVRADVDEKPIISQYLLNHSEVQNLSFLSLYGVNPDGSDATWHPTGTLSILNNTDITDFNIKGSTINNIGTYILGSPQVRSDFRYPTTTEISGKSCDKDMVRNKYVCSVQTIAYTATNKGYTSHVYVGSKDLLLIGIKAELISLASDGILDFDRNVNQILFHSQLPPINMLGNAKINLIALRGAADKVIQDVYLNSMSDDEAKQILDGDDDSPDYTGFDSAYNSYLTHYNAFNNSLTKGIIESSDYAGMKNAESEYFKWVADDLFDWMNDGKQVSLGTVKALLSKIKQPLLNYNNSYPQYIAKQLFIKSYTQAANGIPLPPLPDTSFYDSMANSSNRDLVSDYEQYLIAAESVELGFDNPVINDVTDNRSRILGSFAKLVEVAKIEQTQNTFDIKTWFDNNDSWYVLDDSSFDTNYGASAVNIETQLLGGQSLAMASKAPNGNDDPWCSWAKVPNSICANFYTSINQQVSTLEATR